MLKIQFQSPADQPQGRNRLLNSLQTHLQEERFTHFRMIVAFAKLGPLRRLEEDLEQFGNRGGTVQTIFGIDHHGTSLEALQFALEHFDETYVFHTHQPFSPTFHPKLYIFCGEEQSVAFVGSNNLTVGGTETNFESNVQIEMELPEDETTFQQLMTMWDELIELGAFLLTEELLAELVKSGLVLSEKEMRTSTSKKQGHDSSPTETVNDDNSTPIPFSSFKPKPSSPLPRPKKPVPTQSVQSPTSLPAQVFVIQIIPHHNSEILLSKTAVNQNQSFFGFPFTGETTSKNPSNAPYPQRIPDPTVNLSVYDRHREKIVSHPQYGLNMVYYERRGEIRITVPSDVASNTPDYSILVMRPAIDYDYDMEIYAPDSEEYKQYLEACNQTMPSGGSPRPRKFGWL